MPRKEARINKSQILSQNDIDFLKNLLIEVGDIAVDLQASFCDANQRACLENNNFSETIDQKISTILVDKLQSHFSEYAILSEEALPEKFELGRGFTWLIDPIDGTHHYLANDSQYSIMIGLMWEGKPVYGCIYNPAHATLYYGGPGLGAWRGERLGPITKIDDVLALENRPVRVVLGRRDKKRNPWLEKLPDLDVIETGSIGYKLSKILDNEADVLLHLAGCLKIWDTAGPVAVALGAGLEVGGEEIDYLPYPIDSFLHPTAIVMGKKGSLDWFRSKIIPSWIP